MSAYRVIVLVTRLGLLLPLTVLIARLAGDYRVEMIPVERAAIGIIGYAVGLIMCFALVPTRRPSDPRRSLLVLALGGVGGMAFGMVLLQSISRMWIPGG